MARQEEDQSKKAIRDRLRASLGSSREALRANLRAQTAPPTAAVPSAPAEAVKTETPEATGLGFRLGDMAANAPGSFIKNAKAVLWDLPKTAAENLVHYAKNPNSYLSDIKLLPKYLPDIAKIIKDDYKSFYDPDEFGENITEDPFRVVSDVAGAASIVGGATATAGKAAGAALRGVSRGASKAALGVGRVGRGIARVEALDPSSVALKGVTSAAKPLANAIGIGRYTRTFKTIDATLAAEAEAEAYNVAERIYGGKLTPAEHDAIIESFAVGNREKNALFAQQNPQLWAKREKMREWLAADEKVWTEKENLVNPKSALDAKAKAWYRYKAAKGEKVVNPDGTTRDLSMQDAIDAMKSGKDEPTFFRLFSSQDDKPMFDAFIERQFHGGMLSRAEARALRGELPTDINQILSHQLRSSIGTQKNIKLARAAQELLARSGDLRTVTNKTTAAEIKALRKAGFAPLQSTFFKKYHETYGRAVNIIAEGIKKPGDMIRNAANAAEQAKDILLRAEEAVATPPLELWAPAHAVNWLNHRLSPGDSMIGSAVRWALNIGGTLPYYKAIATVLNPRYWIANAVGDAALSLLYGVHPQALRYAHKLRELVPDEIRNIGINKLYNSDYNLFMRTANRFQNYAQNVDNFFKRATFINEAVKEGVKAKLLTVGRDFFVAEDQLIPFIANMRQKPNQWVNNLEEITRIKERVAAKAVAAVEDDKLRGKLGARYARAASAEGPKGKVVSDVVYSGEKAAPELYPDLAKGGPGKVEATAYDPIYGGDPYGPVSDIPSPPSVAEEYRLKKANLKRILADPSSGNDNARAIAIDTLVQDLAQLGKQLKKEGKAASSAADVARVEPFSGDLGLAEPSVAKSVGPYDYEAGPARELSTNQQRIRTISRQLDENQAAKEEKIADLLYQIRESGRLAELSPGLEREAMMADRAIDVTARFFASYTRLHPWEKKVVRQFIPFYTFTRAMTQLAFRLPFMMPKRQMVYLNLWRTWNDMMDNDGPNNSFFRSVVPVMALEDGSVLAIKVSNLNPFGSVRTQSISGLEVPSAFDLFGNHPVLRLAMGARGQMTPKPLRPGELGTRLDNGEVWEYKGGMNFKRVLLQPSWAKSLWSLFPQGQLLDSLLPGAQEEGGFLLNPKTIMKDGKPLYPIGWPERLLTAIVPATRFDPQEMMRRDVRKLQQIRRSYMKELRNAGEDKRRAIMTILREMSSDIRKNYLEY